MNYYSYQDIFYNSEPCLEFYTPNLNHVVTVEHATSPEPNTLFVEEPFKKALGHFETVC